MINGPDLNLRYVLVESVARVQALLVGLNVADLGL